MKTALPLLGLVLLTAASCAHAPPPPPPTGPPAPPGDTTMRSRELARRLIIADGHIDVPYRLQAKLGPNGEPTEDISQRTSTGDFDYPRAVEGGLDVAFMSIYVPADLQDKPGASRAHADALIDLVEKLVRASPDKFALARSPDEARRNTTAGKVSLAMGIENGSALEDSLPLVTHFQKRGVRYITLTHSKDNLLGDASYVEGPHRWGGLSPLGRQVVAEMNRVGIMVDVAHLSDATIRQVLETSTQPVIASHSSCRHFTPGFERNLSDELIRGMAAKGGVVMINFGSDFLTKAAQDHRKQLLAEVLAFAKERGLSLDPSKPQPELRAFAETWMREHTFPHAHVEDVADHIDHVVKLVGIEHVGLGSDFEGVGPLVPVGLQDVSQYPNLFRVLLERGYSEADLEKIASGNLFRVWTQVEAAAKP